VALAHPDENAYVFSARRASADAQLSNLGTAELKLAMRVRWLAHFTEIIE
jgi:hypothetical protein